MTLKSNVLFAMAWKCPTTIILRKARMLEWRSPKKNLFVFDAIALNLVFAISVIFFRRLMAPRINGRTIMGQRLAVPTGLCHGKESSFADAAHVTA